jgi:5-methyltetrahydrofolate--homocysteine methyltransferase
MTRNLFLTRLQEEVLIYASVSSALEWGGRLKAGGPCESGNFDNADLIFGLYRDYIKAGVDIIVANTLNANRAQLLRHGLANQIREINLRGLEIAQQAADRRVLVAGGIGPTGDFSASAGGLTFENVLDVFREQIVALNEGRPDLLLIKNISEIREMKAALIAGRELFHGPIICEMVLEKDPEAATDVQALVTILAPFQPDVVGVSCSNASELLNHLEKMVVVSQTPLAVTLDPAPREASRLTPEELGKFAVRLVETGAAIVGGGIALTPEHVREIALQINHRKPAQTTPRQTGSLASQSRIVQVTGTGPTVIIGNRLDAETNPAMRKFLQAGNHVSVLAEAKKQIRAGAPVLLLCVAAPGVDETRAMAQFVADIEKMEPVALCLCSENSDVLEAGLQNFTGKGLVWLTKNDEQRLIRVLPLVKKYGAAIILPGGLAENRQFSTPTWVEVLEKRLVLCRDFGVDFNDVWIDCSLPIGEVLPGELNEVIQILREIKGRFSLKTVFSFRTNGLNKPVENAFLTIALANGLDVPVIDPFDTSIRETISAVDLVLGRGRIDN